MCIDDIYHVERVLAQGKDGRTELVSVEGAGPFVRKKMARELVRRGVWFALLDCDCARLPKIEATYQLPDEFVVVYDFIPGENLQELVGGRGACLRKRLSRWRLTCARPRAPSTRWTSSTETSRPRTSSRPQMARTS